MHEAASSELTLADQLRREFDQSFIAPARSDESVRTEVIVIGSATGEYALPLSAIAGLHPEANIVDCPSRVPELRGIANVRGTLVPVYDLPMILGDPPAETRRWLVIAASSPVALAFDRLGEFARPFADAISESQAASAAPYMSKIVRLGDRTIPILDIAAIVEVIGRRITAGRSRGEPHT
jgi:chemotaxis signal transduction protein